MGMTIAKMLLNLGMHRRPLLSGLTADLTVSIHMLLVASWMIGIRKSTTCDALVIALSANAGLLNAVFA